MHGFKFCYALRRASSHFLFYRSIPCNEDVCLLLPAHEAMHKHPSPRGQAFVDEGTARREVPAQVLARHVFYCAHKHAQTISMRLLKSAVRTFTAPKIQKSVRPKFKYLAPCSV